MRAIRKVERALNFSTNVRHGASQHIGNFLKGYMLGIIALLNDILQDVQGRKTDDMKRKVLFGLNALVREVGPSINAVAPQVSLLNTRGKCASLILFSDHGDFTNNRLFNTSFIRCSTDLVHIHRYSLH